MKNYEAVLNADRWQNQQIVVVGGGPTGCEIALHLAESVCRLSLVEMMPKIGKSLEAITRKVMLSKLKLHGVVLLPRHRLKAVREDGVSLEAENGIEKFLRAEKVVVATGTQPDTYIYQNIKNMDCENSSGRRLFDAWRC